MVLRLAHRNHLAARVKKLAPGESVRIVARGSVENLVTFAVGLDHLTRTDAPWTVVEQIVTPEDAEHFTDSVIGATPGDISRGSSSSGQQEAPGAPTDSDTVDSGSTASARIMIAEMRRLTKDHSATVQILNERLEGERVRAEGERVRADDTAAKLAKALEMLSSLGVSL